RGSEDSGSAGPILPRVMEAKGGPQAPSGPVIYYQDPDGKPIYSAEPKSTPDGRPYRAVHRSSSCIVPGARTGSAMTRSIAGSDLTPMRWSLPGVSLTVLPSSSSPS